MSKKISSILLIYLIVVFSSLFLLLSSCNNMENTSIQRTPTNIIKIPLTTEEDYFSWNNIKIDTLIPFETKNNCLISEIQSAKYYKDYLFIHDFRFNNLFCFQSNGKFLRKIGRKGKGPSEYLEIRDFQIVDDKIYILDYNRIHIFNFNNGEFLSTININNEYENKTYNFSNLYPIGTDNFYLWALGPDKTEDNYPFLFKFKGSKIQNSYLNEYGYRHVLLNRFIPAYNSGFFVLPIIGDYSIYHVINNNIFIDYKFEFENKVPTIEFMKNAYKNGKANRKEILQGHFKDFESIVDSKKYLYFSIIGPVYIYEGLIDKISNQVKFGRRDYPYSPIIFHCEGDQFFGYIEPPRLEKFKNIKSNNIFYQKYLDIKEQYDINTNSNPILVKFSLIK